jgi:pyridoxal phosphate enzyme (YggS family)
VGEISAGEIAERYSSILDRIAAAAARSGRDPHSVRLVVVTKGQPIDRIRLVVAAGADLLGENYADEAVPKIEALGKGKAQWVMIGHVQSRKSGLVAEHFNALHSLDSVKLARRLDSARESGNPLPALVQVNVSSEEAKSGLPSWEPEHFMDLVRFFEQVSAFPNLQLQGLMTVPPFLPVEEVRPFFRRLADLRVRLQDRFPDLRLDQLSMGMSGDFEAAIEEGATLVRIGTAIMGSRG